MAFDFFQSHNGYNQQCKWWSRNEDDENTPDELIMKRVPTGVFFAKEVSPQVVSTETIGDSFMFNRDSTTIKSPDNLWGIKKNDLVEYEGEKWIIENVQKPKARIQQTLFAEDKNCSHFYYIELRK